MADEAKPDAAKEAPKKGGFLSSKLFLIVAVVLVLGLGAGGYLIFAGGGKKGKEAAQGEKEKPKKEKSGEEEKPSSEGKEERAAAPKVEEESGKSEDEKVNVKEEGGDAGEASPEGGHEGAGEAELTFKFDPMVVNIFEKNSIHFLKFGLEALCSTTEVMEEIKSKKAQLQDRLLFLSGDVSVREISTAGGKALLKEDIVITFNKVLKKGKIKEIYFTEFTIQ